MALSTTISRMLVESITRMAATRFEKAVRDPVAAQKEVLLKIVRANAGTSYGRRYGFSSIASVADYRRQVPAIDYNDIKSDMERVTAGEKNVLIAEDPILFVRTSGTTGDPKYIPVTRESKEEHNNQMRTWIYHAQREHQEMFNGKVLVITDLGE